MADFSLIEIKHLSFTRGILSGIPFLFQYSWLSVFKAGSVYTELNRDAPLLNRAGQLP